MQSGISIQLVLRALVLERHGLLPACLPIGQEQALLQDVQLRHRPLNSVMPLSRHSRVSKGGLAHAQDLIRLEVHHARNPSPRICRRQAKNSQPVLFDNVVGLKKVAFDVDSEQLPPHGCCGSNDSVLL